MSRNYIDIVLDMVYISYIFFERFIKAMSRLFAYIRVSKFQQERENQIQEIKSAGFNVEKHRIITETISGSVQLADAKDLEDYWIKWRKMIYL